MRALLPSDVGRPRSRGDRLKIAIHAAASAWGHYRGRPPRDPIEALEGIPTVAPGEPVPEVSGSAAGWWGVWEVRVDAMAQRRSAFAMFLPDLGGVRPDIADSLWDALSRNPEIETVTVPSDHDWERLAKSSLDYAYRPCAELAGGSRPPLPSVRPLLVVRVQP